MSLRREAILLCALLAGALALRLYVSATAFYGTFDTSTVGVMALDILAGERPLFYYGQNYLGALEAYVAAGAFALFGPSLFTLSLAPTLFSLFWLAATWWLIRRLYGAGAGLAAVAVFAAPGWHSLWFNLASYGGYPGAFFFGTVSAALAVEAWKSPPRTPRLALSIAGIGWFAGLALWTNFLSAPWLALAAGACVPLAWQRRSDPWLWAGAAAGLALLLLAAAPVWLSFGVYESDPVSSWTWHRGLLRLRWSDFLRPGLRVMAFSGTVTPAWWRVAVIASLTLGVAAYSATLALANHRRRLGLFLLPLAFMLAYLIMSLPHHLAATRAFRYLIPFWSALCIALFALPCASRSRFVRCVAVTALALFCLLQTGGSIGKARRDIDFKQATIEARDEVDAISRALGHPPVLVVGDRVLGYRAMNHNFWSGGESRFASSFDDRNQRMAEEVESARHHLLGTAPHYAERVENALRDLGIAFTRTNTRAMVFFDPQPSAPASGHSLLELRAYLERPGVQRQAAPEVVDRMWDTGLQAEYAEAAAIYIEFPTETELDAIVLQTTDPYQDGLPALFRITAFDANGAETWSRTSGPRFSSAFVEDGRVFMKGYFGQLESRLNGVRASALRIEPLAGAGGFDRWSIHEVYLFPAQAPLDIDLDEALAEMIEQVRANADSFVMAPRALSAWLREAFAEDDPPRVYRRFNPRFATTMQSRFFEPGMTVVTAERFALEVERLLAEVYPEMSVEGRSIPPWRVFRTESGAARREGTRLVWNGHLLLKTEGPEPVWHLP